jgi:hypothetical protein
MQSQLDSDKLLKPEVVTEDTPEVDVFTEIEHPTSPLALVMGIYPIVLIVLIAVAVTGYMVFGAKSTDRNLDQTTTQEVK